MRHDGDDDVRVPLSQKGDSMVSSKEVLPVFMPYATSSVISSDATQQLTSKIATASSHHSVTSLLTSRQHEDAYSMKSSLKLPPCDADDDNAKMPVSRKGDMVSSKEDLLACGATADASVVLSNVAQQFRSKVATSIYSIAKLVKTK